MIKIKRALISVSDKTGLAGLADMLYSFNVEILSTGGTAKAIKASGVPVIDVSDYTGFPEMMDGRVKTLHPTIHGGLLAIRDNKEHMDQAKEFNIGMIDMVVVNLYPFEQTVAREGVTVDEAIENVDIGGPSMLRSAAKNFKSVTVITSPEQYSAVIKEMRETGGVVTESTRKKLALEVFRKTSLYDSAIYEYFSGVLGQRGEKLPNAINLNFEKVEDLRYGENPHQRGALYKYAGKEAEGMPAAKKLQGKEISFNNIMDLNSAIDIVRGFKEPACAIIKHNNPCGAASAATLSQAYIDALDSDRLSAFGSVVGFNGNVDGELAETILREADFVECIIAPSFDQKAKELFAEKKNLRLVEMPDLMTSSGIKYDFKRVDGGVLVQDLDAVRFDISDAKVVTKKKPTDAEMRSMEFGWKIVKAVRSNAIVFANGTKTVGIGAGQMSRVDSVVIASTKAGKKAKGACVASDAFFPKADSIDEASKCGITAIIQPGGSIRDNEVIAACDKHGIAMVLTGVRHFRH